MSSKQKRDDPEQSQRFEEEANKIESEESDKRFEEAIQTIVRERHPMKEKKSSS